MRFNKDKFRERLRSSVNSAISSGVLNPSEDVLDTKRLSDFIKFQISSWLKEDNRNMALSVLKNFNYDETTGWDKLEAEFGKIKSVSDIALINLWMFLQDEGMMDYSAYEISGIDKKKPGIKNRF